MHIAICAPVYNDWPSAKVLLAELDAVAARTAHRIDVVFVDDGSSEGAPEGLEHQPVTLASVSVLRLRRNLGHQRAIAIGLTYLYVTRAHDAVVVMDSDGEDRPSDVLDLIERCAALDWSHIVFAQRTRRSEGSAFRLGYATFKLLHRLLVGRRVEVGNFSVVPRAALARLVAVSEMWNHYAASVYQARIPRDMIAMPRGQRIAGQSKMNWVALVMHGLSAISVYSDVVGVRLLGAVATAIVVVVVGIVAVLAVKLGTALAIPGWATNAMGVLLVSLLSLTVLSVLMSLFTLRLRSEYAFLPLRDYAHFVLDERTWHSEQA